MKYATTGDIHAEFERDFNREWPTAAAIIERSEDFVRWYQAWLDEHEVDEEALFAILWGEAKAS